MAYSLVEEDFLACCGSTKFAEWMVKLGPYFSLPQAIQASREIWWGKVNVFDWMQAFKANARIGDVESLKAKTLAAEWSKGEQGPAIHSCTEKVLQELVDWNQRYEEKFGFRFMISASGKSSSEILESLKARFFNRPVEELQAAAAEEQKIIEIRLNKLFAMCDRPEKPSAACDAEIDNQIDDLNERLPSEAQAFITNVSDGSDVKSGTLVPRTSNTPARPPITTHVLDVSRGIQGAGIDVA